MRQPYIESATTIFDDINDEETQEFPVFVWW